MGRLQEVLARMAEIRDELLQLETQEDAATEDNPLPEDFSERVSSLTSEFDELEEERQPLQADFEARERVRRFAGRPGNREGGDGARHGAPNIKRTDDPFDPDEVRNAKPGELRSRAERAIDSIDFIDERAKEAVVDKMKRASDVRGVIPGLVLHTGHADYQRAFHKGLAGRQDLWTNEERSAVARVEEFRAAMSLTDANGGYAVPFTLDPTLIMTDAGSANPFRQIARVVPITTDSWNGVSTAGVTASWDGEIAEVSDDSPTFAQPSVTAEKAQAFVQASIEITQDYQGLAADLGMLFQDAKDDLEAAAFVSGTGANQPQGITTALDGGSQEIAPSTTETFAFDDVEDLLAELPPKYRSAAARVAYIVTNGLVILSKQQLRSENSAEGVWTNPAAGQPGAIHGVPYFEASELDDPRDINAAATADNFVAVVGDWRNYLIADRVGMSIEFIPHLFNTSNNLPDGRRGWYAHWRVGADSVNDNAFRMLSIPTTA